VNKWNHKLTRLDAKAIIQKTKLQENHTGGNWL